MNADESSKLSLAPAEWQIMKVLWADGPLAARDVYAALPDENGWAYKTVKTLLSRLVAKQAIDYEQIGNSYLYRAVVAQEEMTRSEVRTVFDRISSQTISPVIANFIEEADLTSEEIAALKRILNKKRASRKSREGDE